LQWATTIEYKVGSDGSTKKVIRMNNLEETKKKTLISRSSIIRQKELELGH
jgi:hypothetical protein